MGESNSPAPSVPQCMGGLRVGIFRKSQLLRTAVPMLSTAACVAISAALPLASRGSLPYRSSGFARTASLLSCTAQRMWRDAIYLTYWIHVHAITSMLLLPHTQQSQNCRKSTQKWCEKNPLNLQKYVAIICKHCKYCIFLWC